MLRELRDPERHDRPVAVRAAQRHGDRGAFIAGYVLAVCIGRGVVHRDRDRVLVLPVAAAAGVAAIIGDDLQRVGADVVQVAAIAQAVERGGDRRKIAAQLDVTRAVAIEPIESGRRGKGQGAVRDLEPDDDFAVAGIDIADRDRVAARGRKCERGVLWQRTAHRERD